MDKRINYIMVLDTETANTHRDETGRLDTSSTLVYDIGWAVADKHGNIYETASFVNSDIFADEWSLMTSAYYSNKIAQYIKDLAAGRRTLATLYEIRLKMLETLEHYNITQVAAHNAIFDYKSLNTTQRWLTKSKYRYWFPKDIEIWDTLKMSRDVILKMPTYKAFCEEHGLLTKNGRLSATAENLYRFIIDDPDFEENHTGLEDVLIEAQIMAYCFKQKKAMRKKLFEDRGLTPLTPYRSL